MPSSDLKKDLEPKGFSRPSTDGVIVVVSVCGNVLVERERMVSYVVMSIRNVVLNRMAVVVAVASVVMVIITHDDAMGGALKVPSVVDLVPAVETIVVSTSVFAADT